MKLLVVVLLAAPLAALTAQADTAVDLRRLRADVKAHPDSFPLVFALGRALARAASEKESEWRPRFEARKWLDRALELRPDDPRPYLEIGLLLRKQSFREDALRVLGRAEQRMRNPPTGLSPSEQAEIHLQSGLTYEVWWEDFEHLGILSGEFTVGSCSAVRSSPAPEAGTMDVLDGGLFGSFARTGPSRVALVAYNFFCPEVYDELMSRWTPVDMGQSDYLRMVDHFRQALQYDGTATRAATRLMRHLAAGGAWPEYLDVATRLARRTPEDATALLFLGLGYLQTGSVERADSAFTAALAQADPDLLTELLRPEQFLKRQDSVAFMSLNENLRRPLVDAFWRARDPLFLTARNERLAEHLARLAYADVAYSDPQSGARGRHTSRGSAWLKFGRPLQIRAMGASTGLLEFWDYGEGPDLVFRRQRTFRGAQHEDITAEYLRYARDRAPEVFAPSFPRIVARAPFQAAAFRAPDGGSTIEVYAALPGAALRAATDAPDMDAGAFVVTGGMWEHQASHLVTRTTAGADTLLDAAFSLPAGDYVVSVEAAAGNVAAQTRLRTTVPSFGTSPSMSDALLVDRFDAEAATVDDRAALRPVVSRTRQFAPGGSLGVVWEIYNLATDSTGAARYTVTTEVADSALSGVVGERGDRTPDGAVGGSRATWEASRVPRADRTVVEFVTLNLPSLKPGAYLLLITVTDRISGGSVTTVRGFAVASP